MYLHADRKLAWRLVSISHNIIIDASISIFPWTFFFMSSKNYLNCCVQLLDGDAWGQFSFELNEFVSGNWHKMKLSHKIIAIQEKRMDTSAHHPSIWLACFVASPISQFAFAWLLIEFAKRRKIIEQLIDILSWYVSRRIGIHFFCVHVCVARSRVLIICYIRVCAAIWLWWWFFFFFFIYLFLVVVTVARTQHSTPFCCYNLSIYLMRFNKAN